MDISQAIFGLFAILFLFFALLSFADFIYGMTE